MSIEELPTYEEVLTYLKKKKRTKHLLLGNGFSMAYDTNIFSYNALHEFIENLDDEILLKLFDIIDTKNFELVMNQLDNFIKMTEALNKDDLFIQQLKNAHKKLKECLINAIQEVHPEHIYKVSEEESLSCLQFLSDYLDEEQGNVFSTNYDLLLYWSTMRNEVEIPKDGFGRDIENEEEVKKGMEPEYSELYWGLNKLKQRIFYLHGALHLFNTGIHIIKETYKLESFLLQNIKTRLENEQYPVFVTAGKADGKLKHIAGNKYLNYCYDKLSEITGSLVTFGFNFGEYDDHLIDAINKATKFRESDEKLDKLYSVYIGVYSESDLVHIKSIEHKFKCKVNYYNASTANIWGLIKPVVNFDIEEVAS